MCNGAAQSVISWLAITPLPAASGPPDVSTRSVRRSSPFLARSRPRRSTGPCRNGPTGSPRDRGCGRDACSHRRSSSAGRASPCRQRGDAGRLSPTGGSRGAGAATRRGIPNRRRPLAGSVARQLYESSWLLARRLPRVAPERLRNPSASRPSTTDRGGDGLSYAGGGVDAAAEPVDTSATAPPINIAPANASGLNALGMELSSHVLMCGFGYAAAHRLRCLTPRTPLPRNPSRARRLISSGAACRPQRALSGQVRCS